MREVKMLGSLNRPSWTSMISNGMWDAYKHLHTSNGIKKGYFVERKRNGSNKRS